MVSVEFVHIEIVFRSGIDDASAPGAAPISICL